MNSNHNDYIDFLRKKIKLAASDGFDIDAQDINPLLKPHQRDIVRWAVQGGNRATFAAVTTLLTAAKSRSELIAAAQTIPHVGCISQREHLSRVFKRRYDEFKKGK